MITHEILNTLSSPEKDSYVIPQLGKSDSGINLMVGRRYSELWQQIIGGKSLIALKAPFQDQLDRLRAILYT